MPNSPYVLPDPVVALQQYLRLRTQVTVLTSASKVVSEIPSSPDYATPYVVVQSVGGVGIWPALDDAALQVDVIGGTKDLCSQVARAVRACVWAIANDQVPAGVLASGHEETAPAWLPDTVPNPPLSRFMSRYRVIIHP